MFKNTPKMIEDRIREFAIPMRVPRMRYVAAAFGLISFYLGREILDKQNDDFFRFKMSFVPSINWEYSARITMIAEILFDLRNDSGFSEICQRLKKRELKQAYSELFIAGMFKRHGFEIYAKREEGERGRDFDFTAKRGNDVGAVEVWMTNQEVFDGERLLKRVKEKRKQLPSEIPGAIACVFPEKWFSEVDRLYDHFDNLADRLFGGSRRINCLFFAHEEFREEGLGGSLTLTGYAIPHPNPRHNDSDFSSALTNPPASHDEIEAFLSSAKDQTTIQTQSEFAKWVNFLLDAE